MRPRCRFGYWRWERQITTVFPPECNDDVSAHLSPVLVPGSMKLGQAGLCGGVCSTKRSQENDFRFRCGAA